MTTPSSSPGPLQGWDQSSTCRITQEEGQTAGKEYGLAEATARTLSRLLRRQAELKFGGADVNGHATLDNLAQAFACQQLEELADRLLTASTWSEWLANVPVLPPAPGMPDYTKDLEIDFEPASPSIDTYLKAGMVGGSEIVIHLRLQKWYQSNLDRILFDSSCKLERKYGQMPLVAVFLMWPSADGPALTGRFEECDSAGRVKRVFTYHLKRAWEIEPEEVMQGVATMLLAPLTRGSKERMPQIVQMIKDGMERLKTEATTRQMVWESVYWSMGTVCSVEEVHRILGDLLPLIQSSPNYLAAKGQAYLDAFSEAQRDGPAQAARNLVLRQATRRFGPLPEAAETLAATASMQDLKGIARRVLTAADWSSLLAKPWRSG